MDKGVSLQNPYANVAIPRAQLKSSFTRDTLGSDLDGVVITNPSSVPTYPTYIKPDEISSSSNNNPTPNSPNGNRIRTQESWRRPYNPYASNRPQNGGHSDAMYTIDLDKRYKDTGADQNACCCYPYCKCCPCCRKSCCVVS
ncbi:cysteine-rich tail protein 1-like [Bufo bufo]|uniref:cysteine-rich tail protein 1-like n=1 Tax=Bufo bufo TaxID=8384 RepID=UPI001ABE3459|nr:cysteine-rich tail protein 1-like [Bufo bufo]XP_040262471.1 cysteine-rich tail protein 1-like [Bufo bufo]XP_040262472.1 cysteine-rich tail protein 1-like [Bufo bufo]XP_040262473.1 cysteine-rich tail protein 1-like [Bufo bufo]XP_040262474.1 cysteine-rich tail protein 1-like [Bufo bufo]